MKTYEERVQEVINFLDTELHDDIFIEDARCIAERFVDKQAEAIEDVMSTYEEQPDGLDEWLIDNGYRQKEE